MTNTQNEAVLKTKKKKKEKEKCEIKTDDRSKIY